MRSTGTYIDIGKDMSRAEKAKNERKWMAERAALRIVRGFEAETKIIGRFVFCKPGIVFIFPQYSMLKH